MRTLLGIACLLAAALRPDAAWSATAPLKVGIIGLAHGHAAGFFEGGALVPAGGAVHRPDIQIVGVVEPDDQVYQKYASRYSWPASMRFRSIDALATGAHPEAALVFTSTAGHTQAVLQCAEHGIHVMMEKPMAISYHDALAMQKAAEAHHIHILTDYETSWYGSNTAAYQAFKQGRLGALTKVVVRDGHSGPQKIHVSSEFFRWLTDPKENGAGALYDFGCYGADLMTWLQNGEAPISVMAVTKHLQPDIYPKVDDEADVTLNYKSAVAILQGSWTWPFNVKDMDVYGFTGYAKTIGSGSMRTRFGNDKDERTTTTPAPSAPYDDPLHYLQAVIRGDIQEGTDVSSLRVNVIVSQILDAARQSAQTGRAIELKSMDAGGQ